MLVGVVGWRVVPTVPWLGSLCVVGWAGFGPGSPGTELIIVIAMPSGSELNTAFTDVLDTGGLGVSALERTFLVPGVVWVFTIASIPDAYWATIAKVCFGEASRVINWVW